MTEPTPPSPEESDAQAPEVTEAAAEQPDEASEFQSTPQPPETPEAPDTPETEDSSDLDDEEQEEVSSTPKKEVPVPEDLDLRVEAALMTTDRAISVVKLSEILGGVAGKAIKEAIDKLNQVYDQSTRSFRIEQLAGGYQIVTLPKYAQVLANLHKSRQSNKLTAAAMETLAIIAYKQPILRAEIEAIRGVSSGETVRSLMERHLVKIVGRAEEIGRPMLYGTTKQFLEVFGLASLKDLPNAGELRPPKPRALIPAKDELGEDGIAISDTAKQDKAKEQTDAPANTAQDQEQTPDTQDAPNDEVIEETVTEVEMEEASDAPAEDAQESDESPAQEDENDDEDAKKE